MKAKQHCLYTCSGCKNTCGIVMKQNIPDWEEEFDNLDGIPFHAEAMEDGTCSVDFTETNKFYKDFIHTHKKQWEEEAVRVERERVVEDVMKAINNLPPSL